MYAIATLLEDALTHPVTSIAVVIAVVAAWMAFRASRAKLDGAAAFAERFPASIEAHRSPPPTLWAGPRSRRSRLVSSPPALRG